MTYDEQWYRGLEGARMHNERAMFAVFALFGVPGTFIDFGCGDGWCVHTAKRAGATLAVGVELSDDVKFVFPHGVEFECRDLREPVDFGRTYDMVISWEVGEHLPESCAVTFAETLARHTDKRLIFTAAARGQGGYDHINCQDQDYWRDIFSRIGLEYDEHESTLLRDVWRWCVGPLIWLPQNVQVFRPA